MSKLKTYKVAVYISGGNELLTVKAANAEQAESLAIKKAGRNDIIVSKAILIRDVVK